jgi:hypothetical protein
MDINNNGKKAYLYLLYSKLEKIEGKKKTQTILPNALIFSIQT